MCTCEEIELTAPLFCSYILSPQEFFIYLLYREGVQATFIAKLYTDPEISHNFNFSTLVVPFQYNKKHQLVCFIGFPYCMEWKAFCAMQTPGKIRSIFHILLTFVDCKNFWKIFFNKLQGPIL